MAKLKSDNDDKLTKSEKRIKANGEVFTPQWTVRQMLSNPTILAKVEDLNATCFEPSAGEGAFVLPILQIRMRLALQKSDAIKDYIFLCLTGLKNIFAVEFLQDNLDSLHQKMLDLFMDEFRNGAKLFDLKSSSLFTQVKSYAKLIIYTTIKQGDTLKMINSHNQPIKFTEWQLTPATTSLLLPLMSGREFTLFSLVDHQLDKGARNRLAAVYKSAYQPTKHLCFWLNKPVNFPDCNFYRSDFKSAQIASRLPMPLDYKSAYEYVEDNSLFLNLNQPNATLVFPDEKLFNLYNIIKTQPKALLRYYRGILSDVHGYFTALNLNQNDEDQPALVLNNLQTISPLALHKLIKNQLYSTQLSLISDKESDKEQAEFFDAEDKSDAVKRAALLLFLNQNSQPLDRMKLDLAPEFKKVIKNFPEKEIKQAYLNMLYRNVKLINSDYNSDKYQPGDWIVLNLNQKITQNTSTNVLNLIQQKQKAGWKFAQELSKKGCYVTVIQTYVNEIDLSQPTLAMRLKINQHQKRASMSGIKSAIEELTNWSEFKSAQEDTASGSGNKSEKKDIQAKTENESAKSKHTGTGINSDVKSGVKSVWNACDLGCADFYQNKQEGAAVWWNFDTENINY